MTRSDIAAMLILLAFLALCWVASLIVRVVRETREDERVIARGFEHVVADAAEVIESVDGRSS